ncbi:DUF1376 domain-containing protein [Pusillimonas caeni]|uniref:YdaU family protein n=1 Tax=Pusillimonas caeni TaxID=1348472 RepID=UPI000E59A1B8|nr:YdaU family protein [Pusillimonas caeni]TFL14199.1 DUF1376 domain-containing protein [Pusillimonas caeni]
MNYYPHHIGDFNSATRHLTRIERSVYRDLMDLYYDTESPLTLDFNALCRLIIARSDEERTAVQQVLNEFFTETKHGWFHDRCDDEILKYQANIAAKSAAGKASAARRAQKSSPTPSACEATEQEAPNETSTAVEQMSNECATNQEPITKNQEPKKKKNTARASPAQSYSESDLVAFGVDVQVATEFLALRRRKGANLTPLALKGIQREAGKAGVTLEDALRKCVERGWQGFEAGWVTNDKAGMATGATRHGNFGQQDYHAGVGSDGSF